MPATKRASSPEDDHASKRPKPSHASKKPLISIEAFLSNVISGVVIGDDDDIFEIVYNRVWAKDVEEM